MGQEPDANDHGGRRMSGQFDGLVRDRNPETSWDAAARQTQEHRTAVASTIVILLSMHGPSTDEQIEDHYAEYIRTRPWITPVTPQSLRTRRKALWVEGRVRPTGEKQPTRSGSSAAVWALTPAGEEHEATA